MTACWCAGRLILGYFQFSSTINPDFGKNLPANDHSMIILSVLVVCDILPICLSLTGSVGILLDGADSDEKRQNAGISGGVGGGGVVGGGGNYQEVDDGSSIDSGVSGNRHARVRSADNNNKSTGGAGSDLRRVLSEP